MTRHLTVRAIFGVPAAVIALMASLAAYGFTLSVVAAIYQGTPAGMSNVVIYVILDGLGHAPVILLAFALSFVLLRLMRLLNPFSLGLAGFVSGSVLVYLQTQLHPRGQVLTAETIAGGIAGLIGCLAAYLVLPLFAHRLKGPAKVSPAITADMSGASGGAKKRGD